jgi:phosphoribosylcarboxyaminoimidazole (NCAIR) mutase
MNARVGIIMVSDSDLEVMAEPPRSARNLALVMRCTSSRRIVHTMKHASVAMLSRIKKDCK